MRSEGYRRHALAYRVPAARVRSWWRPVASSCSDLGHGELLLAVELAVRRLQALGCVDLRGLLRGGGEGDPVGEGGGEVTGHVGVPHSLGEEEGLEHGAGILSLVLHHHAVELC